MPPVLLQMRESPMTSLSGSCSSVLSCPAGISRPATPLGEMRDLAVDHSNAALQDACASPSDIVLEAIEAKEASIAQVVVAAEEAEMFEGVVPEAAEASDNVVDQRVLCLADVIASQKVSFQSRLEFADLQCAKSLQENERLQRELEASRDELCRERRSVAALEQERQKLENRHRAEQQRCAAAAKAKSLKDGVARARLSEQLAAADAEIRTLRGDPERLRALSAENLELLSETLAGALVCVQREHRNKVHERADEHLCSVCMIERKDSLLQPCHHLALCTACSMRVQQCPQCRSTITGRLKVYT